MEFHSSKTPTIPHLPSFDHNPILFQASTSNSFLQEATYHHTIDDKFLAVEKTFMQGQTDYMNGEQRLWAAEPIARGRAVCTDVIKGCSQVHHFYYINICRKNEKTQCCHDTTGRTSSCSSE